MRLGVFARTFPGTEPLAVLGAARAAGFDSVQWNWACAGLGALPQAIPAAAVAAVRRASEETGVAIAAASATYNMIHPDPAVRRAGRAAFGAIAEAAAGIGTRIVTVCTGSRDPQDQWRHHPDTASPEAWADFEAEMESLLGCADACAVALAVEPEPANVVSGPDRALAMLDRFRHPRLGIVLDPANLFEDGAGFRGGAVVDEAIDALGPRIVLAHAKDRSLDGRIVPAGQGAVDWGRVVRRLRAAGFEGDLVAHGFEAGEAAGVARALRAALP